MDISIYLHYALAADDNDVDVIVERLGAAGWTDAIIGTGTAGILALQFDRSGISAVDAVVAAHAALQQIMPTALLVFINVSQTLQEAQYGHHSR